MDIFGVRRVAASILVATMALTATAWAQPALVTLADLQRIAPTAKPEYLQAIVDSAPLFEEAEIDTRLRMAHFLTQVMTETGGLGRLDENLNYSQKTLLRVFSRKTVSEGKAKEIANDPVRVANWVYGARLGNLGRDTQDGWNYRGSGYLQLTGRSNFRDRGTQIGVALEENPDLARTVPEALSAAIAYWKAVGINGAADKNDLLRVRKMVNGPAAHGYDQAKVWFNRAWVRVFRDKGVQGFESSFEVAEEQATAETAAETDQALFDAILVDTGLVSATELANEGIAGIDARAAALKAYQGEVGLPETGVLDEATQDALLDPREWRYRDEGDTAAVEPTQVPTGDPEQTVVIRFADASAAPAGSAAATLAPNQGTGATAARPEMAPEDSQFLESARAIYSEYEMEDTGASPETFKPYSVIGDDTRVAVTDTTGFPARAVVQILFTNASGGHYLCTGALISPDTVLTAAHCIHSGTTAGSEYQGFRLLPGRNLGAAPFGACGAREAYVLSGWTTAASADMARDYDIGAIKLDCSVGDATGWLGVRALADDEVGIPTVVEGYAADRAPTGRQWKSEDKLDLLAPLKGFYQNDTFGGTSGSPVFTPTDPDTVIGVHTNGLHGTVTPWSTYNAFTRITPARLALIQTWAGD